MWAIAPNPDVILGKLNITTQLHGKCQRWQNYPTNVISQSELVYVVYCCEYAIWIIKYCYFNSMIASEHLLS